MNSSSNAQAALLITLAEAFQKIQDPRDPRGVRHDFQGMVILKTVRKYLFFTTEKTEVTERIFLCSSVLSVVKKTPICTRL